MLESLWGERLMLGPSLRSLTPFPPPPPPPGDPNFCCVCSVSVQVHSRFTFLQGERLIQYTTEFFLWLLRGRTSIYRYVAESVYFIVGLNIFYLYTLYIEQHIKTYKNIQYTNGIQKKVFRLLLICIPFKLS